MNKITKNINRLSSITLLKLMLIAGLFPWIIIDTGIILYHLFSGDFIVNYVSGSGAEKISEQISLGKYVLISYPLFILTGVIFTVSFWFPIAFSLWLWSKFRNIEISYYEIEKNEI